MTPEKLKIYERPNLHKPRLLIGFSGWMDGGDVSTGTVQGLVEKLDAEKLGEIDPNGFYIYSFPGSMEITALFRPHAKIIDGEIKSYTTPSNAFYYSEQDNLKK